MSAAGCGWAICALHAHIMSGTISPLLSELVDPQTRQSFSPANQLWRPGGQYLCFSDYSCSRSGTPEPGTDYAILGRVRKQQRAGAPA